MSRVNTEYVNKCLDPLVDEDNFSSLEEKEILIIFIYDGYNFTQRIAFG
jgi:hypothetical protein